jgi:hypothetical protein
MFKDWCVTYEKGEECPSNEATYVNFKVRQSVQARARVCARVCAQPPASASLTSGAHG